MARRCGSVSSFPMPRAHSWGACPVTSAPDTPSRTAVTRPPTAAATTGVPDACASSATRPKDSLWLGPAATNPAPEKADKAGAAHGGTEGNPAAVPRGPGRFPTDAGPGQPGPP